MMRQSQESQIGRFGKNSITQPLHNIEEESYQQSSVLQKQTTKKSNNQFVDYNRASDSADEMDMGQERG